MVIVLATEPKVRGFKSRQECWIFKRDKIHRISFGGEVKLLAPCQRYYWYRIEIQTGKIQRPLLTQFLPALLLGASASTRAQNSGGWIGNDKSSDAQQSRPEIGHRCMRHFVWYSYHPVTVTGTEGTHYILRGKWCLVCSISHWYQVVNCYCPARINGHPNLLCHS
jgi:hypothetical protein